VGEVRTHAKGKSYKVVVARTGEKGEVAGALATSETVERWRPRHVLVVGIAGGIPGRVSLGDVVLGTAIWSYEVGHLGVRFKPDAEPSFTPDEELLRAARGVDSDWPRGIQVAPPAAGAAPDLVEGRVASGNMVIETSSSEFFADISRAKPDIIAVEMEGAGAAAATREANELGDEVGFLMIRAISDLVQPAGDAAGDPVTTVRNPQRDLWKDYAADVAATFAVEMIRSSWPTPPR
jgi:nucleoside phosphorylase